MRIIYLPGLDASRPGESLGRFFQGLRSMDAVAFSHRDNPHAIGQRWFRLDQRHDVSITEIFWLGADDYVQAPPNIFMRTFIGLRTLVFWLSNPALWSATVGRGGMRFAGSILIGLLLFLLWGTTGMIAIADALGLSGGTASPTAGVVEKLLTPVFAGVPLLLVLVVAVLLSAFQVDRAVMFSAYLADFDRDRAGLRGRKAQACALLMRDILNRDPPRKPRECICIVGHSMGGTVALDLILDIVSGEDWPPVDIVLVTFGAPVRMFRSSRDPGRGPALFAQSAGAGPAQAGNQTSQVSWIDLYSGRDYFSAPMFDQPFSGTHGTVGIHYRPVRLDDLNAHASFTARIRGETHSAYLHDPTALEVALGALRESA